MPLSVCGANSDWRQCLTCGQATDLFGALGGSRTPDHLVRSQVLYPTELPAQRGRIIFMRHRQVNFNLRCKCYILF